MKKFCEVCGKEFETNVANKKTCSEACRKKKDSEYMHLYRKAHRKKLTEYNRRNRSKLDNAIYNFRASAKRKGLFWAGDC